MNDFIFTNDSQTIRISNVPDHHAFEKLNWHMRTLSYRTVPGGNAKIAIHFNRIANWVTGWCPPSFAEYAGNFESRGSTTPREVFRSELTKAINEDLSNNRD